MIELRNTLGYVLYASETARTFQETLVEAVARRTPLPNINLEGRDLGGMNLAGMDAPGASCRGTHFLNCDLQRAHMPNSDFSGANLGGVQAAEANFQGSDFSEAQLGSINMPGANLDMIYGKGIQACNAILDYCSFRGADLPAINLAEASLLSTDWTNAKLLAANLYNAQAQRSQMINVAGQRAKFSNADLRWSSISGDFSFANFEGALLTGATLGGELKLAGALFQQARGVGPDTSAEAVLRYLQNRTNETKTAASAKPSLLL